jgi:glycosyltransferase involved in cell wall biosynthesis
MADKFKIITMSDHPLVASGVGTQTRYIIEGLLKTGKYSFRSLGGAIKHNDYRPQRVENYGDDWFIFPVNGYGDEVVIREILDAEKPDAVWFMTDPRFYIWLFNMSDEIRDRNIPLLYYHVWDNYPVPKYNAGFYKSCDYIGCISKLTHDIVCQLGMQDHSDYIPHAVNHDIFKPMSEDEIRKQKIAILGDANKDKFVVFYNSRNARRKMTSDVLKVFKGFADKVGQDKVFLFMHTDPHDEEGANLYAVAEMLGIKSTQIGFSNQRIPPEQVAIFYNISDVTMNISNNEGFGLSCLESLSCGTPAIVNETGGLQDQIRDETGFEFGVSVKPATRSLTGSQAIPYILDDRCADEDLINALVKMYNLGREGRREIGRRAREWTLKTFSMEQMIGKWDRAFTKYITSFKEKGYEGRIRVAKVV